MSMYLLRGTERRTDIVHVSSTKKCTVELITIRKDTACDPLTLLFKSLPDDISSHSIRVGVVSKIMAEQAILKQESMGKSTFVNTVWLGGMYHHIPEQDLRENLPSKLRVDSDNDLLPEIVGCQCECIDSAGFDRLPQDISLAARLVRFADMLDEHIISGEGHTAWSIVQVARYIWDKGAALYGLDAIECFGQRYKEIFDLYLGRSQRVKNSWI